LLLLIAKGCCGVERMSQCVTIQGRPAAGDHRTARHQRRRTVGRTPGGRAAAAKKRQEHEVYDAKRRDDGWMTRRFSSFPYAEPSDLQPVVVGPILMCIDVV